MPGPLTAAARRDPRVSWAIAEELNRRLYDTLEHTAVNAFGSVRQRVAAHLLDLASAQQHPRGRLVARVSQQELADAAGSVREVVARVLRDLRAAGIVATASDSVVYIGTAAKDLAKLIQSAGPGVLTVGEGERFVRAGGMIGFVIDNRRVRFDINQTAADRGSLKLSSKLLSVARSVER